jgi:hypothetical protein
MEIEDHILTRNPQAYWNSGTTPFGHTSLGCVIGPTGDSPLAGSIIDGSFTHLNHAVSAFTHQLRQRSHYPSIPAATVTEKQLSRAFGGLQENTASSPSGLYKTRYMCLASKKCDDSSNPIRTIQSNLMEMPIAHGFAPYRQLVQYVCDIYKHQVTIILKSSALFMALKQLKIKCSRSVSHGRTSASSNSSMLFSMNFDLAFNIRLASVQLYSNTLQPAASCLLKHL